MNASHSFKRSFLASLLLSAISLCAAAANPFVGHWELTIPGGGAGWLGVEEKDGKLAGSILWGGGSVVPVTETALSGDTLVLTRVTRNREGAVTATETIEAKRDGNNLSLTTSTKRGDNPPTEKRPFSGRLTPPMPAKPDLAKVKFGEPIQLLNGKDLTGWRLLNPNDKSAWSVSDGVLSNNPVQPPQPQPRVHFGNLRTDREFEDFNLVTEVMVPKGGNSGIYLRGIYEVQVSDSHGRPVDSHNMGAIYSRIKPTESAEKPAGEWQNLDITLVDRHATVKLNGKTIIDNQPVPGCTGGALWSDVSKPGPIYLQGDHTGVSYRNMVIRPVVK